MGANQNDWNGGLRNDQTFDHLRFWQQAEAFVGGKKTLKETRNANTDTADTPDDTLTSPHLITTLNGENPIPC